MNKEILEDRLYNAVETISSIQCTKCKKVDQFYQEDDWQVVSSAMNKGWYATENYVYCPDCQFKRKKK